MSKGEQTRQRIVETASELFWTRSYHGVSVAEIADEASVNKASLYQYFGSKEELALAVVLQQRAWAIEGVFEQAFKDARAPEARLRRIYEIVFSNHSALKKDTGFARGCPFINSAMELADANTDVREAVDATFSAFGAYYRKIVDELAPKSAKPADKKAAVKALLRNMNGAMVASKIEQRPAAIMEALPAAFLLASAPS